MREAPAPAQLQTANDAAKIILYVVFALVVLLVVVGVAVFLFMNGLADRLAMR